jgi:hypothetical protein
VERIFELPLGRSASRQLPRERQPAHGRHDYSVNAVADGDLQIALGVLQFVDFYRGFAFAADVDERHLRANRDDRALDGLALLEALRFERSLEHRSEVVGGVGHGTLLMLVTDRIVLGQLIRAALSCPLSGGSPCSQLCAVPRDRFFRDLLTHTSGLMSGPISTRESGKVALKPKETLADFLPRLKGVPLEFQPGSRWAYSPTGGFDVLARVIEVASGRPVDQFFRERIFEPLGMKDTFFYPVDGNPRLVTVYAVASNMLEKRSVPNFMNGTYFSGGGGLMSTAEDYLQFATMLLNRGEANGRRLLAPRTVDLMASAFAPDTLPGRTRGTAFGLSVRVVTDPSAAGTYLSEGSFGWSGAYGTHFWVDPKEKLVAVLMTQTSLPGRNVDFETAVMQSVVSGPTLPATR